MVEVVVSLNAGSMVECLELSEELSRNFALEAHVDYEPSYSQTCIAAGSAELIGEVRQWLSLVTPFLLGDNPPSWMLTPM